MKARFVLTTLLSAFFALSSINVGFAQDRPVIIVGSSGGGSMNPDDCWDCIELDNGCDGFIKFRLQVANLELYAPNTSTPLSGNFYWPNALPDLYIQMKVGGVLQGTYLVDGAFQHHSNYGGYNLYRQNISLPVNIQGLCNGNECIGVELSLVQLVPAYAHKDQQKNKQASTSTFVDYPIGDFAAANEVFSSSVFAETCHLDDKNPDCSSSSYNSYQMYVCCRGCLDSLPNDMRIAIGDDKLTTLDQVSINPNPFQNQLVLNLGSKTFDQAIDLKVIDSMGRVVYHYTLEENGEHRIDGSQLQPGIYYFRIQMGESIRTQKLLKF